MTNKTDWRDCSSCGTCCSGLQVSQLLSESVLLSSFTSCPLPFPPCLLPEKSCSFPLSVHPLHLLLTGGLFSFLCPRQWFFMQIQANLNICSYFPPFITVQLSCGCCNKLNILKQELFSDSLYQFYWAKITVLLRLHSLAGCREACFPCFFQFLVSTGIPWLVATSFQSLLPWAQCLLLFCLW